jgi:glyoxylase-like metal-dependent hydrolase (beta-lactamase superfamily II)
LSRQRRRSHEAKVLFGAVLLAVATFASAQQDFSKVEVKAIHVAKNIYMLTGSGGNIGVSVGPDGILIVDDQFAPLAEKIEAALKQLHPGKLKFVLNTHYHGDHTGGNAHFGRQGQIIAHTNVRKRLGRKPGAALRRSFVGNADQSRSFGRSKGWLSAMNCSGVCGRGGST